MYETGAVLIKENTDDLISRLQRAESERTHQMLLSVVIGGIIGWAVGVAQLIVIGSWDLFYWAWMPLIPLYNALGLALYGMIIGGSGVFSKPISLAEENERQQDAA